MTVRDGNYCTSYYARNREAILAEARLKHSATPRAERPEITSDEKAEAKRLRKKRAAIYDGRLSLGAGIWSGILASFVASLVVYSFLVSYTHFVNPIWIEHALEVKVAQQRAAGVSEAAIQQSITLTRNAYTPAGMIASIIVGLTLMGGIFSLVLTLLVRSLPHRPD